jgi:hypothetical protein
MLLGMVLGGLGAMVGSVRRVAMGGVGMMRRLLVVA